MFFNKFIKLNLRLSTSKLSILLVLFSTFSQSTFANKFYVCSAYLSGPFVTDEKSRLGLLYTFTDFLNKKAQGKYSFEVLVLPRSRLLLELRLTDHCIVPFVSYKWFDPNKQLYYWSQPLLNDANIILSSQDKKLESIAKERVSGMSTSQVIGFIDEQVAALIEDNTVSAFNSVSLENSVGMVARKRIDFVVSGKIPVQYLTYKHQIQDQVYLSKNATTKFERSVLVPKSNWQLIEFIEQQIGILKSSSEWQQALAQFGIDDNG